MSLYSIIEFLAYIFVILGALNWGMVGVFGIDVVARIFGAGTLGAKVVYILIGLAAIIIILL